MHVHPIEYRYGTSEMKKIWNEKSRVKRLVLVEVALLKALTKKGYLSKEKVDEFEKKIIRNIDLSRIKQIEAQIKHDIMALVKYLSELADKEVARWIHFGATSNDIIDSATATQIRDSLEIIEKKLKILLKVLNNKAITYKDLVCLGRTHGQAALPTTYGFRFALWASEIARHLIRLRELRPRVCVGKMSGAVGTQAGFGRDGFEIENESMKYIQVKPVEISSQIIPRDVYCEYITFLANLATTLEKIATTLRLLQRSEVGEVLEKFEKEQVGSSTMPHKRNPIICEQICSLARVIRGFVIPQYECSILWEERDLTNSAAERIILTETTILLDYILTKAIEVLENLQLNKTIIERNLKALKGLNLSEAIMLELTKRGMERQKAHEIVREAAIKAIEANTSLLEQLVKNKDILKLISPEELENITKPEAYLGTAKERVEKIVKNISSLLSTVP